MRVVHLKAVTLLVLFCGVGVVFKASTPNQEVIYESLGVLAEILTLSNEYAPEGVTSKKLTEGAINGFLKQLDPHSNYYNAQRFRTMREDQKGSFYGIGIIVGYQNRRLTVVTPIAGSPAASVGIRAGDVISKIEDTTTADLDMYEAIRLLRGEKDTKVNVTITRNGLDKPLAFAIVRAEIPSKNVQAHFMLDQTTGYISLKDFGETATAEVAQACAELAALGMKQLVLDLRGNPGGLLPQAIGVSSLFIPGGKLVVSTKGRLRTSNKEYHSQAESPLTQMPLIVLINRGSASASEIVAGAIQDHDRGLVLGINSWGKGLVQSVFPLDEGNKGLALTTARYYTPSGRNIQGAYKSLSAYYNPESSESIYFEPGEDLRDQSFTTTHGRQVMQVRGITPDVYITEKATPAYIQNLDYRHSAFFNFATTNQDRLKADSADWRLDPAWVDTFKSYLTEQELDLDDFEEHRAEIAAKLRNEILYIGDIQWAFRDNTLRSNQVKAAMKLFHKAEELLKVYNGQGEITDDYTLSLREFALLHREPSRMLESKD